MISQLGDVDAERFIALVLREPFDYTRWRENHLESPRDVRELSHLAMDYCSKNSEEKN